MGETVRRPGLPPSAFSSEPVLVHQEVIEGQALTVYWIAAHRWGRNTSRPSQGPALRLYLEVPGRHRKTMRRAAIWPMTYLHQLVRDRIPVQLKVRHRAPVGEAEGERPPELPGRCHPGCHCKRCRGTDATTSLILPVVTVAAIAVALDKAMEEGKVPA